MIKFLPNFFVIFLLILTSILNVDGDFCIANETDIVQTDKIQDFLITEDFIRKNKAPQSIQTQSEKDFLITDDFILKNSKPTVAPKIHYRDYFAENSLKDCKIIVYGQKKYDFQNINHTYVKVHSVKTISTKIPMNAGDGVNFIVSEDVIKDGKILVKKGEKVTARIETISDSGEYGVAADIIISNFKIGEIPLSGELTKEGFTHAYWVIPVSNAAGFFIPFSNYAFKFIHGGHAKIKPSETFKLQLPDDFCQLMKACDYEK